MKLSWERLGIILANLGRLWGSFSAHFRGLGGSSSVLGSSWAVLGHLGRLWGACWADFWSILPHLRSVLGGFGEVLGGSWAVLERLGGALGQIFLAKGS